MNELQIFKSDEFGKVRMVEIDHKLYFVGRDIAIALGYSDTDQALRNYVDDEDKLICRIDGINKSRNMKVINESGLYSLILRSKHPNAKKFKKWVIGDVLLLIRKHGMYETNELIDSSDLFIAATTKLEEERAARIEAERQRNKLIHQNKLYTTSEIAKELGLSSANKLNGLLAEKKVQYRQNNTWLLYSKYAESGYVSIKQQILDNGKIIYDRKWTGTGRDFILDILKVLDITN